MIVKRNRGNAEKHTNAIYSAMYVTTGTCNESFKRSWDDSPHFDVNAHVFVNVRTDNKDILYDEIWRVIRNANID